MTAVVPDWLGLAVAIGVGLLIGLERERHKGVGADREAAGIRTFSIAALSGALSIWLALATGYGGIAAAATFIAGGFAIVAYRRSSADPGLTTEVALFAAFLLGGVAVLAPALAAAVGVGITLLLAARTQLRYWATEVISDVELHDGLLLAALALIALPLLHMLPGASWWGVSPYALLRLIVVMLVLQTLGHVAQRLVGAQRGLWWAGLSAGLVSSTATIAALGAQQRTVPVQRGSAIAGALASGVSTWLLALGLVFAASPATAAQVVLIFAAGAVITLMCSLLYLRAPPPASNVAVLERGRIFQLAPTALIAIVLLATTAAATWAQQRWGATGVWLATSLAALADAHASVGVAASLHASGGVSLVLFTQMVLIAIGVNTAVRCVVAWVSGGATFFVRIALGLWIGWAGACAVALLTIPSAT